MFFSFPQCPLIIDPAGRAVPAGLGATLIGRLGTGTGLDTLRNELKHTLAADGHNTSAMGESFEVTAATVEH